MDRITAKICIGTNVLIESISVCIQEGISGGVPLWNGYFDTGRGEALPYSTEMKLVDSNDKCGRISINRVTTMADGCSRYQFVGSGPYI